MLGLGRRSKQPMITSLQAGIAQHGLGGGARVEVQVGAIEDPAIHLREAPGQQQEPCRDMRDVRQRDDERRIFGRRRPYKARFTEG